jgi:demethylmenaquinone methyltransferase/2-methoxy-6-polyprenyl-1,4-benzoquinol methylase
LKESWSPRDERNPLRFREVDESEKAGKVAGVFHSVASKYDVMNDLMSGGMHRLWKVFTIAQANVRPGQKVLDIAGGTGDLAKAFAKQAGPTGEVWLTDINESMLRVGRDRLLNKGVVTPVALCDAEKIPFPDNYFDLVTVAFGLRNMTAQGRRAGRDAPRDQAGRQGHGARVLEGLETARKFYDVYSFKVLPWLGERVAGDAPSYRYLAESIRMHPTRVHLYA